MKVLNDFAEVRAAREQPVRGTRIPLIALCLLVVSGVQPSLATTNGSSSQIENVYMYNYIARTFPELCPYEPLCYKNATKIATGDLGSCCFPCSCREHCYLLSNCCPDKQLAAREPITKVTPSADMFKCLPAFIGKTSYKKYYNMVHKCPPNTTTEDLGFNCENEDERDVSDMTPLTDLDTGITYRNAYCARCHGVTSGVPWTSYYSCSANMFQTARRAITTVASLFHAALCHANFSPPSAINVQSDRCYDGHFDTCSDTGNWRHEESSELMMAACEIWKPPYFPYGNVYCAICSGMPISGLETCIVQDQVDVPSHVFTAVLNYASNSPAEDPGVGRAGEEPDVGRAGEGGCPAGMIMDFHAGTCREFVCPQFKHLLNGHCENLLTNYHHVKTLLVLKLVTDDLRFIGNETVLSKKTAAVELLTSLTNGRRDLSVSLQTVAETTADFPGTRYLTVLATVSSQAVPDPDILQWLYDRLNQSFSYTTPAGHVFNFDVSLNARIYIPFLNYYRQRFRSDLDTTLTDLAANSTLVTLYHQPVRREFAGIFLSRLMFCQQIRLNQSEYKDLGVYVVVLAANINLYTFDFMKISATSEVRVCVEDYLAEPSPGRHAAGADSFRLGLVYSLVVVIAVCLVAGALAGAIVRHRRLSRLSPSSS